MKRLIRKVVSKGLNFTNIFLKNVKGENNKIIIQDNVLAPKLKIKIIGDNNRIEVSEDSLLLDCNVFIKGNNNRVIIDNNFIGKHVEFWIQDDDNLIEIKERVSIGGKTHFAATEGKTISIGEKTLFASDIVIRTGDSHSIIDMESNQRINYANNVRVSNT